MAKVTGGASLGVKLSITQYENLNPSYWAGWEEEVPEDWTDEQKRARIREIHRMCRGDVEELIDEDAEDLANIRIFMHLDKTGKRTYTKDTSKKVKETK